MSARARWGWFFMMLAALIFVAMVATGGWREATIALALGALYVLVRRRFRA